MKHFTLLLCLIGFISINSLTYAQNAENTFETDGFYDYKSQELKNVDTIPGYTSKSNKLKISGTIYKSDGITPAEDVILYIQQADENGDFDIIKEDDKSYVYNRGWIKTDANGHYTFYTYVPGNDRRYNQMQQLYPIIKEPSKSEYALATFLFDDDPLLTKRCRKRMAKKSDLSRILKTKLVDGLLVVEKDIVLPASSNDTAVTK